MEFFFTHNRMSLEGPFDIEDLKLKKINKHTPIWSEGKSRWTTAGKVKELQFLFNDTSMVTETHYMINKNIVVSTKKRVNITLSFLRDIGIIISIVIVLLF